MSRVLSISAAECCKKDGKYHAYLLLCDETDDNDRRPLEEIHFSFTENDEIKAYITRENCISLEKSDLFPRLKAHEAHTMTLWNAFLKIAIRAGAMRPHEEKIPFHIHGENFDHHCRVFDTHCRAGVQTAFELTGMPMLVGGGKYSPVTPKSLIRFLNGFSVDLDFDAPLDDINSDHESLIMQL